MARRGPLAGLDIGTTKVCAIVGEVELLAAQRPDAVSLPGVGADWLAARGLRAALLRPDRYIAYIA